MDFKSFITEGLYDATINHDSAKFIEETHGYAVYRGIEDGLNQPVKLPVRKDRKPKGMGNHIMRLFNKAFEEVHSVMDLRSSCVFATGDKGSTNQFGQPFKIYPIGDYSYWWSDAVLDINYSRKWADHTKSRFFDKDAEDIWFPLYPKAGSFWVYYKWAEGLFKSPEVDELIYPSIVEFIKWANYKNIDLVSAIKSGVEIMFICNSYWAVPDSH